MKNQINKPITVIREEVIDSITSVINNSMLPAFVIENILRDMHLEAKAVAQKQYEIDRQRYEEALAEYKNSLIDKEVEDDE